MPRTHKPVLTESIIAAVNVDELRFIGFDGNYCGANAKALGVSAVITDQGQQCPVHMTGVLLVKTAGAITRGSKVASDANGNAITFTTGEVNGFAMDDAAGAGEIIRIARGI